MLIVLNIINYNMLYIFMVYCDTLSAGNLITFVKFIDIAIKDIYQFFDSINISALCIFILAGNSARCITSDG